MTGTMTSWFGNPKDPHLAYVKAGSDWIVFYPNSYEEAMLLTRTMHNASIVICNKNGKIYERHIYEVS